MNDRRAVEKDRGNREGNRKLRYRKKSHGAHGNQEGKKK